MNMEEVWRQILLMILIANMLALSLLWIFRKWRQGDY